MRWAAVSRRDKPADTAQYFLARDGRIARETYFSPQNLERILASASPSVAA